MKIKDLKPDDAGRKVIYTSAHGKLETGIISSWNDTYIFVRYGLIPTPQATAPEKLEFEFSGWNVDGISDV